MRGEYGGSKIKTGYSSSSSSSSGGGFFLGILLFLASFPLLFWNEGSAVKTAKALEEGKGIVVSLASPSPSTENEGKLVHFTGKAVTEEVLKDSLTGIEVQAIKMSREAEMYQWKENSEEKENKTDYYYEKVWSNSLIDSSGFFNKSYSNPSQMKMQSEAFRASNVTVGEFTLSANLVSAISSSNSHAISEEEFGRMPDAIKREATLSGGELYFGANPANPQIGDTKVKYLVYQEQTVSVVAKQVNSQAAPYVTSNGKALEILYTGAQSAEQIFASEQSANEMFTWMLRAGGVLIMYMGLMMSIGQISRLFSWIPLLGSIVESGMAIMVGLLTLALSFMVISIAWIFYRPIVGGGLLLVSAIAIYLIYSRSQNQEPTSFGGDNSRNAPPPPLPE